MKRFIAIAMACMLGLTACAGNKEKSDEQPTEKETTQVKSSDEALEDSAEKLEADVAELKASAQESIDRMRNRLRTIDTDTAPTDPGPEEGSATDPASAAENDPNTVREQLDAFEKEVQESQVSTREELQDFAQRVEDGTAKLEADLEEFQKNAKDETVENDPEKTGSSEEGS